jgi:glycosyltransferase involved in cell wall biosynthesis
MLPAVSVLTVTQQSRQATLLILKDLLEAQTYPNIVEWVLVEGSQTKEDALANAEFIQQLKCRIPISYIGTKGGFPIGTLRQIANEEGVGEIRVNMDDDDYYPPERVSHAVECLLRSGKQIAGCSPMFMMDYQANKMIQFKSFGPNHSVGSAMAWTRAYPGLYDLKARKAEEGVFTNGFREPMVQLDPALTIIQSSHGSNTFPKTGLTHLVELKECLVPEPFQSRYKTVFAVGDIGSCKAGSTSPKVFLRPV